MGLRSPSSGRSCFTAMGGCPQPKSAADQVALWYRISCFKAFGLGASPLTRASSRTQCGHNCVARHVSQPGHSKPALFLDAGESLRRENEFSPGGIPTDCARFIARPYLYHTDISMPQAVEHRI